MQKKSITKHLHSVTLTLVTDGEITKQYVLSSYGVTNLDSTNTQDHLTRRANQEAQLTELLNTLEKKAAILLSKSSEVLDTFLSDTTHLVGQKPFIESGTITK